MHTGNKIRPAPARFRPGIVVLFVVSPAFAEMRFVDDDAPLGGDGLAWSSAYRFLQDALTESQANWAIDEIRVAGGRYTPSRDEGGLYMELDTTVSFVLDRPIALHGGFGGLQFANVEDQNRQDPQTFETTLSGDLRHDDAPGFVNRADNSDIVVVVDTNDDGNWTLIEGLTIRDGDGPDDNHGAGLVLRSGALRMSRLLILGNRSAFSGGGVYALEGSRFELLESDVVGNHASSGSGGGIQTFRVAGGTIHDCLFAENLANTSSGGGVSISSTSNLAPNAVVDIRRTTFRENVAINLSPLAIISSGGGISFIPSSRTMTLLVDQCEFIRNSGEFSGGAISASRGIVNIFNSKFVENRTPGIGPELISLGSAISSSEGVHAVMNCVFTGHDVGAGGFSVIQRRIVRSSDSFLLANSTIVDNRMPPSGITVFAEGVRSRVKNCIIRDNQTPAFPASNPPIVHYSNIEGGWTGVGNIDANPQFVDATGPDGLPGTGDEDLRIGVMSPCIDAGSNGALPPDVMDLDNNGDVLEPTPLDLNLSARRVDVPGVLDTGSGAPPVVDMGAYEFRPESDADGDGQINAGDYALFHQCLTGPESGGPQCPGQCCDWFDADHDDDVDMLDFHALLLQME